MLIGASASATAQKKIQIFYFMSDNEYYVYWRARKPFKTREAIYGDQWERILSDAIGTRTPVTSVPSTR